MLSGFLITYLMVKEYDTTGAFSIKNFYIRRILRIWPVYYVVLLIGFSASFFFPHLLGLPDQPIEVWWKYVFFMSNFDVMSAYENGHVLKELNPLLSITWSVAIEEQFYLVWPLLFWAFRKYFKWLLPVMALFFFSMNFFIREEWYYCFHSFLGFYFICMGASVGYYVYHYGHIIAKYLTRGLSIVVYAALFTYLFFYPDIVAYIGTTVPLEFIITMFYVYLLFEQTISTEPLINWGRVAPFRFMGKYTYGVYLYHHLVILVLGLFVTLKFGSFFDPYIEGVTILMLSLGVSMLSYHFMEKYFLGLKEKFSRILSGARL
jgi:peptidoglycan/LPS O-acetylase OafA/YrhL